MRSFARATNTRKFLFMLALSAAAPALLPASPALAQTPEGACQLAESGGVARGDAETATRLICSEIVQAGAPPDAHYHVAFGTLGSLVIVSVDREDGGPQTAADSRSMTLHGIEEVRVAGPRLAAAIVHGSPIVETETVDNLVDDETRLPLARPVRLRVGMGLAGALAPYEGMTVAPGLLLDLHYEISQFEIGGSLRFSTPSTWASQASSVTASPTSGFVSASLGGRYFTSNKDFSPYLGGGLAYSYYRLALPSGFDGNASGLGVYVDAGIEIFRTHHSRLAIGARFDLPLFALNDQPNFWPEPGTPKPPSSLYFAPVSVEARFTF
jgi:hypothetical protein